MKEAKPAQYNVGSAQHDLAPVKRQSTWTNTIYPVIAHEGKHKSRQIKLTLHRHLLSDGNGPLIRFDDIDNILIGNASTLCAKLGKGCNQTQSSSCFSIVTKDSAEYDFQASRGRDRYEIIMKMLALSGYKKLKKVANAIKRMNPEDTMKLLLCLKGMKAESSRNSLLNMLNNKVRRTSEFLRSVEHTGPDSSTTEYKRIRAMAHDQSL